MDDRHPPAPAVLIRRQRSKSSPVSDAGQNPGPHSTTFAAIQARDGFSLVRSNILEMSQNVARFS